MANRWFQQTYYTLHKKPVQLDCNFVVDSTNGNGYGVRSLKGAGVARVYMNTSASMTGTVATSANQITAIAGGTSSLVIGMPVQGTGIPAGTLITSIISSSAVGISQTPTGNHASESITYQAPGSPNPAAGYIYVVFQDYYNYYIGGYAGFVSPVSGSTLAVNASNLTPNAVYTIVLVGTSTTADWVALGVPIGVTPAVGVSFVAAVAGAGSGTGLVEAPAATGSGVDHIEVIGDPNQTIISNLNSASAFGLPQQAGYLISACYAATSSSVTTLAVTAPANNTVIGMTFVLSNSFITDQGY